MAKNSFLFLICLYQTLLFGQTNPVITSWLQNTTTTGKHYNKGNSTPIDDGVLANVQQVRYSSTNVYINTNGVPAYVTGPFLDGNPSLATAQNAIFKFPLNPTKNNGTLASTTPGNIGVFINGVALFDYRDGVAWNTSTNALCGGPGNPPCPGGMGASMPWNRDAVVAERVGFDCSKGHPAMGNYHHHQNPSAFKLDKSVISSICNLYDADGLYVIDSTKHSPLIGFAYDGFPIYGAYAYKNANGTGGITRIKSGYQLRNITQRTHWADGTDVSDGPTVSTNYPLGYFREDYEFIKRSTEDYLDEHNGRFCITPEYPNGTYAYFCTVDANHNSSYPYAVGPKFYGVINAGKVTSVNETTTTYKPTTSTNGINLNEFSIDIFPNPANEFIAIQSNELLKESIEITLYNLEGKRLLSSMIHSGSTIAYIDIQSLYTGVYLLKLQSKKNQLVKKVMITKE